MSSTAPPAPYLEWPQSRPRPSPEQHALAAGHAAFRAVLTVACPIHDAEPGQACWTVPSDTPGDLGHLALCGERVAARHQSSSPPQAARRTR